MFLMISMEDGEAKKLEEEPNEADWNDMVVHLKIEGDKAFTMDEDGTWNAV